jgi:1,6-anhydro-N-acetylmuramate kinase
VVDALRLGHLDFGFGQEAALRAAASMEEHSKATQQLAATLTDEIARAKAGEEQSAETAEELRRRVAEDQAVMEAEKTLVRQQVRLLGDVGMPCIRHRVQQSTRAVGGMELESLDCMLAARRSAGTTSSGC